MSYGWLTESSLLPRRAVKIGGVSESSLYTLSNQIFSLQQEQQQKPLERLPGFDGRGSVQLGPAGRKGVPESAAGLPGTKAGDGDQRLRGRERGVDTEADEEGRVRRRRRRSRDSDVEEDLGCVDGVVQLGSVRRWGRPSKKPLDWQGRLMAGKNPRVEERAATDEQFLAAHAKTVEASRRKLEEKAKLYDDVITPRTEDDRRTTTEQKQFLCALSKETERRREEVQETKKQRLALLRSRLLVLREAAAAAAAAADSDAAADALMKAAKAEATLNRESVVEVEFGPGILS
ncbi:conserved hypothetical protein [Neospora caninum Liverpool]|uniref:Uncharacterized protein n=1 Tax=Neospora caninum (strain Liverpool) TaxID=572307 RepID=F0V867_NEOCL|nr:conserved hypothetical protein [Neospora caninum Liverpool]CBZ49908.1 conserved hypothetical protein [Neospora caninum Liverpool]|eukprot:XP_003879943.1 conserved hypothetical protein [Neospora caninum Liverpool]